MMVNLSSDGVSLFYQKVRRWIEETGTVVIDELSEARTRGKPLKSFKSRFHKYSSTWFEPTAQDVNYSVDGLQGTSCISKARPSRKR